MLKQVLVKFLYHHTTTYKQSPRKMVKERVWKHTRLDRNATEILDNVKEEMEADGISAPSYSEAIRKLKHDRDTAQQKQ